MQSWFCISCTHKCKSWKIHEFQSMKLFMSKARWDSSAPNSKGMWQSITFAFNITPTVCWMETVTAAFRRLRGCCSILAAVLCLYSPRVFDMNDSQLDSTKGILPDTAGPRSHSRVYHLKAITPLSFIFSLPSLRSSLSLFWCFLSVLCIFPPNTLSFPNEALWIWGAYVWGASEFWQKGTRCYQSLGSGMTSYTSAIGWLHSTGAVTA